MKITSSELTAKPLMYEEHEGRTQNLTSEQCLFIDDPLPSRPTSNVKTETMDHGAPPRDFKYDLVDGPNPVYNVTYHDQGVPPYQNSTYASSNRTINRYDNYNTRTSSSQGHVQTEGLNDPEPNTGRRDRLDQLLQQVHNRPSGGSPLGVVYLPNVGNNDRRDNVDGDEPGLDPQLLSLTQPHMVMAHPRYPRFADEQIRMRTFVAWKNPFPSMVLLVRSGFFFLGGRDSVQCFHCGIILHSWEESDIPDEEHRKHSPNCVFLKLKTRQVQNQQYTYETPDRYSNHVGDFQQHRQPEPPARNTQQQHEVQLMRTVAGLGHSMGDIEKAMNNLKLAGKESIDTNMLVDAVFEIEDNEDFPETLSSEVSDTAGATGGVGQYTKVEDRKSPQSHTARDSKQQLELDQETRGILEKAKQLERENEDLRKQTTCRVCFEKPATEVFLPCGHLACCEDCSGRLSECPYCRKKILRTVHVFLP